MKVYLKKLLEDRIQFLEKEIYKKSYLSMMKNISPDDKQDLNAIIFEHRRELNKAKSFYFKLDKIDYKVFY